MEEIKGSILLEQSETATARYDAWNAAEPPDKCRQHVGSDQEPVHDVGAPAPQQAPQSPNPPESAEHRTRPVLPRNFAKASEAKCLDWHAPGEKLLSQYATRLHHAHSGVKTSAIEPRGKLYKLRLGAADIERTDDKEDFAPSRGGSAGNRQGHIIHAHR
jgi:cell pole-organizing protein PopZ